MSKYNPTIYRCNFCGAETPLPERWYRVISLPAVRYGTQKSVCMDELEEQNDTHACKQCGDMINMVLLRLGIRHEFDVPATTEPWVWGRIFIP